jgi:hypothetical protein
MPRRSCTRRRSAKESSIKIAARVRIYSDLQELSGTWTMVSNNGSIARAIQGLVEVSGVARQQVQADAAIPALIQECGQPGDSPARPE